MGYLSCKIYTTFIDNRQYEFWCSLVPRPSHWPVCDFLQCAKWRGKSWSILSREWISVYLDRQRWGGIPDWKNNLFVVSVMNVPEAKNVPLLIQSKEHTREICFLDQRPLLPSIYLGRYQCHSRDKMDHAFSFHFCILQVIKTGHWEGLGTRLTFISES